jgi:hypothetical protein
MAEYRLNDGPNVYGCHDPQCLDSSWDHECPVTPEQPSSQFTWGGWSNAQGDRWERDEAGTWQRTGAPEGRN